mmetsp:Transcript_20857/g.23892  ORF Transcript_20857/g.23892 Transcript_20857/m.23892 type:complete len:235 (+) Transcript_20857:47-751(+)
MLFCIGGVCVPYSAIVPLILLGLRWVVAKLQVYGLVPKFLSELMNLNHNKQQQQPQKEEVPSSSCCNDKSIALDKGSSSSPANSTTSNNVKDQFSSSGSSSSPSPSSSSSTIVKEIQSEPEFDELLLLNQNKKVIGDNINKTVVKFTASWCKPCHNIQPFYEQKSKENPGHDFLLVDVDELDGIASRYNVAMLPTFLILTHQNSGGGGTAVTATYRGSNKHELEVFLTENLAGN